MPAPSRRARERQIFVALLAVFVVLALVVVGATYGPAILARLRYQPREGDVIFQSLPHSPLVSAIEGATESPFSHCGIVARLDGNWVVYEAYAAVGATPLSEFLVRGRDEHFAVYRWRDDLQPLVPQLLEATRAYQGRPYDVRYQMDDEKIYCSELIYKAYRDASGGETVGKLVRFGDLRWQPFEKTITQIEQGPVPVDRQMITPKDLAAASQLQLIVSFGLP